VSILKDILDRTLATKHGEAAYGISEKLMDAGHESWWVGGAIRQMIMNEVPEEIDIATSALPDEVSALFPKSDTTDKALGAVRISYKGALLEVTTFREDDSQSDGRHPESVRFGSREHDALRRDATINAIYFNPISRELYDPCKGVGDLSELLVRFIGDPETRIRHDALRILRMVRLKNTINGQYDLATRKALVALSSHTSSLSGTRVLQELEKILQSKNPAGGFEDLWELGILKVIFPELHETKGVAQPKEYHKEGDVFEHLKLVISAFTDDHKADVRIAALFHDIGKPQTFAVKERIRFDHHAEISGEMTDKILCRLQMPSKRREKICWLISHHMMMNAFESLSEVRKAHWYFHPWFKELLQLFWLDAAGTDPGDFSLYDWIINDYNSFLNSHPAPKKPLLNGEEIMEILSVTPGAKVGEALRALHDAQIRKEITTKAEAYDFLKERNNS